MVYDVIIVGGGGAGLLLARELSKQKHKVLIIDKNKDLLNFTFYTLASFINLEDFELSNNVVAQNIDKILVKSNKFTATLKANLYTLDKKEVHKELLDSIDKDYVDFELGVQIKNIIGNGSAFNSVIDKNGKEYLGKIFVDATGTAGVLSKNRGLQSKDFQLATGVEYNVKYNGPSNEIQLLLGKTYKGGYGWLFPLKNDRAIIGFGTIDNSLKKGLKERLNQIINQPEFKSIIEKDNDKVEGGSVPITPVLDKFVLNNLVCVGDSVSQVNPIAGEGYKFVFESAIMANNAIDKALKQDDIALLFEYEKDWRKRFLANYKRSKIAQERINNLSKSDLLIDLGVLLFKLRSNKSNLKSISGEYF